MRILQQHLPWMTYLGLCILLATVCVRREVESRTLRLDAAALRAALASAQSLRGRPLSPAQELSFEAGWIRGQILLHEARRRGLDRGDPLIRASVLGRVTLALAPEIGTPTAEELRRYFDSHRRTYEQPAVLRISLATFPSRSALPEEALVRARLEGGERPEDVGPSLRVGAHLEGMSIVDLRVLFGGAFAEHLFDAGVGPWMGPLTSTLGVHYVRIDERTPPRQLPFAEIAEIVRQDWIAAQEERIIAPTLERLRSRTTVAGLER